MLWYLVGVYNQNKRFKSLLPKYIPHQSAYDTTGPSSPRFLNITAIRDGEVFVPQWH